MERLTYRANTDTYSVVLTDGKSIEECLKWKNVLEKLAEYEDLEEKRKLMKLPCAVGDTVWHISEKIEKEGRKRIKVLFIEKGNVDNITLEQTIIPQITDIWIETEFSFCNECGCGMKLCPDCAKELKKKIGELELKAEKKDMSRINKQIEELRIVAQVHRNNGTRKLLSDAADTIELLYEEEKGIMQKGIKEKDIKDFKKYAKKLSDVVEHIRQYNPKVNGFMNNDDICLMLGDWRDSQDKDDKCVVSVHMPNFDGGAW